MNERIEKLAEQANAWYPMGYPSGEGGDAAWENLVIFQKEDLEKFAELIVRECANACLHDDWEDPRWGRFYAKTIREHFGVEE